MHTNWLTQLYIVSETLQEFLSNVCLIHMHNNLPGIRDKINQILADNGVNIVRQHLMANGSIGHVITDINKKYNKEVIKQLGEIDWSFESCICGRPLGLSGFGLCFRMAWRLFQRGLALRHS